MSNEEGDCLKPKVGGHGSSTAIFTGDPTLSACAVSSSDVLIPDKLNVHPLSEHARQFRSPVRGLPIIQGWPMNTMKGSANPWIAPSMATLSTNTATVPSASYSERPISSSTTAPVHSYHGTIRPPQGSRLAYSTSCIGIIFFPEIYSIYNDTVGTRHTYFYAGLLLMD
jgi:hypothetical protein